MRDKKNIVESVNFISAEELLVQELDQRLSFDVVMTEAPKNNCVKCEGVCGCLFNCDHKQYPPSCGVRG